MVNKYFPARALCGNNFCSHRGCAWMDVQSLSAITLMSKYLAKPLKVRNVGAKGINGKRRRKKKRLFAF